MPSSTLQQLRKAHMEEERALGFRMWSAGGRKQVMVPIRKYMGSRSTRVELRLVFMCWTTYP